MTAEALSLGAQLARDTVGRWIRGTTVPTPSSLQAVEEVLGARLGFAIDLSAAVSERRSTQQRNRQPADEDQGRTAARADWSEMASEGISMLEVKPSALDAELSSRDRRTRTTLGESLRQTGLLNVFASWEDATAEMSAAVADPQTIEIRLLGLDLTNWFAGRRSGGTESPGRLLERLLLDDETGAKRRQGIRVRVLLLDPRCTAARVLTRGAGVHESEEWLELLRNETRRTAEHLSRLSGEVDGRQNGNSLQVRFYDVFPGFFAFTAELGTFIRPYYAGIDSGPSLAPVWQYGAGSAVHEAAIRHFDVIWETSSVPCNEYLKEESAGVDQGIKVSGICNIYSDLASAQQRITWLIGNAQRRVWIQGVSLIHHLSPPLEDAILRLLLTPSIDARFLILDPDCEQARLKSYRDYLLDHESGAVDINYNQYTSDQLLHQNSLIYANIQHTTQRLMGMAGRSNADHFQLRHYTCAPTAYMLIADDHLLVEQFHYGKPPMATDSMQAQLHLAREMPLIEYHHPSGLLFEPRPDFDPLAVAEDHFSHIFNNLGIPPHKPG